MLIILLCSIDNVVSISYTVLLQQLPSKAKAGTYRTYRRVGLPVTELEGAGVLLV